MRIAHIAQLIDEEKRVEDNVIEGDALESIRFLLALPWMIVFAYHFRGKCVGTCFSEIKCVQYTLHASCSLIHNYHRNAENWSLTFVRQKVPRSTIIHLSKNASEMRHGKNHSIASDCYEILWCDDAITTKGVRANWTHTKSGVSILADWFAIEIPKNCMQLYSMTTGGDSSAVVAMVANTTIVLSHR